VAWSIADEVITAVLEELDQRTIISAAAIYSKFYVHTDGRTQVYMLRPILSPMVIHYTNGGRPRAAR
jgi:hypothetical protein